MPDESSKVRLLFSVAEAAKALSISTRTLWTHSQPRGQIPCVKLGARTLYSPDALKEWASQQMKLNQQS
jgi:hypothetical protein